MQRVQFQDDILMLLIFFQIESWTRAIKRKINDLRVSSNYKKKKKKRIRIRIQL